MAEDARRGRAEWVNDGERPLRWLTSSAVGETFTPAGLAKHIIREASGKLRGSLYLTGSGHQRFVVSDFPASSSALNQR
jgi:hypothetical protein